MRKKIFSMAPPETVEEKKARTKILKDFHEKMDKENKDKIAKFQKETGGNQLFIKTKNLRMFGDRVLIKQHEAPKMIGGIIIPDADKRKPARGTIVGTGSKCAEAKAGEDVYFGKYAGTVVTLREGEAFQYEGTPIPLNPGEDLLIMREADVFMSEVDA